jgi:hypothetical protein
MAEVAVEAMEGMADSQDQFEDDQPPTESVEPTGEPAGEPKEPAGKPREPEKAEPAKEPAAEDDLIVSKEDMEALFDSFGEVEEEPPAPAPRPPTAQPPQEPRFEQQPDIPQDVFSITPQQFMPEGQDFDPMDAYTPGSPSNRAVLRAQAEQTRRINAHEREREKQEQIARQGAQAIQKLNARMEREKWPPAMRQRFWNRMTNEVLDLDLLADSFILSERKALRKAQKAQQSGSGGEPPPVSKASRVTETPKTPDAVKKEAEELFGPRRQAGI